MTRANSIASTHAAHLDNLWVGWFTSETWKTKSSTTSYRQQHQKTWLWPS